MARVFLSSEIHLASSTFTKTGVVQHTPLHLTLRLLHKSHAAETRSSRLRFCVDGGESGIVALSGVGSEVWTEASLSDVVSVRLGTLHHGLVRSAV